VTGAAGEGRSPSPGADWLRVPPSAAGMRIALYGGSFNPPHRAHLAVARLALARLGVDRVWWMVTPGNPLKAHDGLAPLAERVAAARLLADDPRIVVTAFEAARRFTYTADTVAFLRARRPGVRFVFVMGADNLAGFHRWERWRDIAALVPMAFVDRPGSTFAPLCSRAATTLARWRLPEHAARRLADMAPPAWVFLHARRDPISSTALRGAASG
jgi:nicotinate-nucleotide adenylyltransferase